MNISEANAKFYGDFIKEKKNLNGHLWNEILTFRVIFSSYVHIGQRKNYSKRLRNAKFVFFFRFARYVLSFIWEYDTKNLRKTYFCRKVILYVTNK